MDIEELTIRMRAIADGVEAGIEQAKSALRELYNANTKSAATAKQAAQQEASAQKVAVDAAKQAAKQQQEAAKQAAQAEKEKAAQVKEAANQQAMAYAALSAMAAKAFDIVVSAVNKGVEAHNTYIASVKGLQSVASGKGIGTEAMEGALESLRDQFFDTASAAAALKNLLSRGYTLDQAVQTIGRLKDAAAFGRQATLGLAEAVVTATSGIKQENSILVDNAGVTKNVSVMWKEYAKAIGVSVESLTQAQKIEAEYQGIIRETALQVGDLEKLTNTLAGTQADAAMQGALLAQSYGEAMSTAVGGATSLWGDFLGVLRGIVETSPEVAAGGTTLLGSMMGLTALTAVVSVLKQLTGGFVALKAAMGWFSAVSLLAGIGVGIYTSIKNEAKKAEEAVKAEAEARKKALTDRQATYSTVDNLSKRYKELADATSLTYDQSLEMKALEAQIAAAYGLTASQLRNLATEYGSVTAAIEAKQKAAAKENRSDLAKNAEAANQKLAEVMKAQAENMDNAIEALAEYNEILETLQKNKAAGKNVALDFEYSKSDLETLEQYIKETEAAIANEEKVIANAENEMANATTNAILAGIKEQAAIIQENGGSVSDALIAVYEKAVSSLSTGFGEEYAQEIVNVLGESLANADTASALSSLQTFADNIAAGIAPSSEAFKEAMEAFMTLDSGEMDASLANFIGGLEGVEDIHEGLLSLLPDIARVFNDVAYGAVDAGNAYDYLSDMAKANALASDQSSASMTGFERNCTAVQAKVENLGKAVAHVSDWRKARKAYDDAAKAGQDTSKVFSDMEKAAKNMGVGIEDNADAIKLADNAFAVYEQGLTSSAQSMQDEIDALSLALSNCAGESIIHGDATISIEDAQARIAELQAALAALKQQMTEAGVSVSSSKSSGGGGGRGGKSAYQKRIAELEHLIALGQADEKRQVEFLESLASLRKSKDDRLDYEERLYAAKEALRQAELDLDYDLMAHRKALGELTLEQELGWLLKIKEAHQLNAEELRDLEEKLYEARKAIRGRDAQSVSQLGQGVIDALTARYEALEEAEMERLDQSRQAWKDWADESVAAIQAQIDALDELAETEDREAKDAQELRKIEKLRQSIQFEQDDYNRAKLQQQLEATIRAREDRLHKLDIQNQKTALQEQIEAIQKEAQAQQEKLDAEQTSLEKAYEERLKAAALQAEAERLMMQESQEGLLALLGQYAPDYDALGQTLGEKLLEGFTGKVGAIEAWFEQFNRQLAQAQEQAAAMALSAADSFYQGYRERESQQAKVVNVEQNNTFNMPVESPAETARRVKKANEALGMEILNG